MTKIGNFRYGGGTIGKDFSGSFSWRICAILSVGNKKVCLILASCSSDRPATAVTGAITMLLVLLQVWSKNFPTSNRWSHLSSESHVPLSIGCTCSNQLSSHDCGLHSARQANYVAMPIFIDREIVDSWVDWFSWEVPYIVTMFALHSKRKFRNLQNVMFI